MGQLCSTILSMVLVVILSGCALGTSNTAGNNFPDTYPLYTVVEGDGQARLYGVDAGGRTLLKYGTPGSMWYKQDTERLYYVEHNRVYRYSFRDGKQEIIYTPPFEDIEVQQVIVRPDEQEYAVLLRSDGRYFDGMVACGQGQFCVLEVGNFQEERARLVALPQAYTYSFLGAWDMDRAHPYLYVQPRATNAEYHYILLDDEGSGVQSLVVKQLGVALPTVELYSNDLRLDIFSFPAVEERNPEGWRVFYFRSAEEIYHRFREEFIIPRNVQVFPSPDMKHVAYTLDDKLFIFSLEDRVFQYKDEQVSSVIWNTGTKLLYQKGDQSMQLDVVNDSYTEWGKEEQCGVLHYTRNLKGNVQNLFVSASTSTLALQISGKGTNPVFCRRDKINP